METLKAEFRIGAVTPEQFPNTMYPEIAFTGRSNVGKSSMLNNLVNNKNLAKVSSTPGKTQQINFFLIEDRWMFADLPGFGYAKVSKKDREKWLHLNMEYLATREQLVLTCLLVDSRHDPMKTDLAMMEWLENNERQFVVILTKCDKISQNDVDERVEQIRGLLQHCEYAIDVMPYSSTKNIGRNNLLGLLRRSL
jgi:GTP-binding protein